MTMKPDSSYKSWLERLSHVFLRPKNREELLDWLAEAAQEELAARQKLVDEALAPLSTAGQDGAGKQHQPSQVKTSVRGQN